LVGGTQREYRAEKLRIATGRRPNTDNIAVEKAGVAINERGEIDVDTFLRTRVPHIFAADDVIGRSESRHRGTPRGSRAVRGRRHRSSVPGQSL